MKNKKKMSLIAVAVLALSLNLCGCGSDRNEIIWDLQEENMTDETETEADSVTADVEPDSERSIPVYADICGAVRHPGVYELETGARIFELIEKAGGLQENADLASINQAEKVTDGMKVRVYTKEEAAELPAALPDSTGNQSDKDTGGKVNINSASQSELMALSGIGASRASDIIAYRTEHGRFLTIEDIMNVSGIKESTFQKIKDQIVVE